MIKIPVEKRFKVVCKNGREAMFETLEDAMNFASINFGSKIFLKISGTTWTEMI